jgi:hypothetical protein
VTQYQDLGDVVEDDECRLESYGEDKEGSRIMMGDNVLVISAKPSGHASLVLEMVASARNYTEEHVQAWMRDLVATLKETNSAY